MRIGICSEKICTHQLDENLAETRKTSLSQKISHKILPKYNNGIAHKHSIGIYADVFIRTKLASKNINYEAYYDIGNTLSIRGVDFIDHNNILRSGKYFLALGLNMAIKNVLDGNGIDDRKYVKQIIRKLQLHNNNDFFYNGTIYTYKDLNDLLGLYASHEDSNTYNSFINRNTYDIKKGTDKERKDGFKTVKDIEISTIIKALDYAGAFGINFSIEQIRAILHRIDIYQNAFTEKFLYCMVICSALENQNAQVNFRGKNRGVEFFSILTLENAINANLPFEITLSILEMVITENENTERFNINGIIYTKDDFLLLEKTIKNRLERDTAKQKNIKENQQDYNYLLTTNVTQSVHNNIILKSSDNNLKLMKSYTNNSMTLPNMYDIKKDIRNIIIKHQIDKITNQNVDIDKILAIFDILISREEDLGYLYERPGHSLSGDFKKVLHYIYSQEDLGLKLNLQISLIHRLHEIQYEDPCTIGQLQRILDIPTGIDERLNTEFSLENIDEEVINLAVKVRKETSEEFASSLDGENIDPEVAELMQFQVFTERAINLYVNFLHIPLPEVLKVINRLKTGFFIESNQPI